MQQNRIARTVRERRLAADWSTEDLAQRAGVAAATVNRIENGKIATPSYSILTRLAVAFGFDSVDAMLGADKGEPPPAAEPPPPAKPPTAIATSGPDERRLTPEDLEALRLIMREEVERVFRERGLPPPTEDELP